MRKRTNSPRKWVICLAPLLVLKLYHSRLRRQTPITLTFLSRRQDQKKITELLWLKKISETHHLKLSSDRWENGGHDLSNFILEWKSPRAEAKAKTTVSVTSESKSFSVTLEEIQIHRVKKFIIKIQINKKFITKKILHNTHFLPGTILNSHHEL